MTLEWPAGYGKHVLDSVTSTLDVAREMASETTSPLWIMAHQQTAARGRRGRAWQSPAGNFAATLILPFEDEPAGQAALRSFVAALAVRDACVASTGNSDALSLKWPNDVLLNERKLAGILLESTGGTGARVRALAIGVGVNLAVTPAPDQMEPDALQPAALSELGPQVAPEAFLHSLATAYAGYEQTFRKQGFAPIRQAWLASAARLGGEVIARTARETLQGVFRDVDADGQLVLETADGRAIIPAADVYFQGGGDAADD